MSYQVQPETQQDKQKTYGLYPQSVVQGGTTYTPPGLGSPASAVSYSICDLILGQFHSFAGTSIT